MIEPWEEYGSREGEQLWKMVEDRNEADFVKFLTQNDHVDLSHPRMFTQETLLHAASRMGCRVIVATLLANPRVEVNALNRNHRTPVVTACLAGTLATFTLLLHDKRVDIDIPDHFNRSLIALCDATPRVEKLQHIIASTRTLNLLEFCKNFLNAEAREVVREYRVDPQGTRDRLRRQLGAAKADQTFVDVVLLCDGYLQLVRGPVSGEGTGALRFLKIVSRLPMELQKMLCHRAHYSPRDIISGTDFNKAFQNVRKAWV